MWSIVDISFVVLDDMTDSPVVTVEVLTLAGGLSLMAEPRTRGSTLILGGFHIQAEARNQLGVANLLVLAQALMEGMGYDGLEVEGAVRTTGAKPGRRPRVIGITRKRRDFG